MTDLMIGCGQITWSRDIPREQVLAEIAQAGYDGAPAGPWGGTPEQVLDTLARHGLKPAPGYLGADFWDADQEETILERARTLASFAREIGCTELYVAAGGFDKYITPTGKTRNQIAANARPEDAMTEAEWKQFVRALNKVGEITLAQGVKSCFHNHVGSTIETREEIDKLFSLVDRSVLFQGPDIGHLAWGGVDPVQFCRDYAADIKTLHIKDINPQVYQEGRANGWDYATFSKNGIFAEIGEGMVNYAALFDILKQAGFKGWVIVETDVTTKSSALLSATISRQNLQKLGL